MCQGLQQSTEIHAIVKHQNHIYLGKIIPGFVIKRFAVSISTQICLVNWYGSMKKKPSPVNWHCPRTLTAWKVISLSYCIWGLPLTDSCSDDKISLLFVLLNSWFEFYWGTWKQVRTNSTITFIAYWLIYSSLLTRNTLYTCSMFLSFHEFEIKTASSTCYSSASQCTTL